MSSTRVPELLGVVLAGGHSRRMGVDKGQLCIDGVPQAERCYRLLAQYCQRVLVSIRAAQARCEPYRALPVVVDDGRVAGPAAGLLAAWAQTPAAALLVLAVDLLRVDAGVVNQLTGARAPERLATTFKHADGTLEPLCTVWEPAAAISLERRAARGVSPSLRRYLERSSIACLEPEDPTKLVSFNSPDELQSLTMGAHRRSVEKVDKSVREK